MKSTNWLTFLAVAMIGLIALAWYGCTPKPKAVAAPVAVPGRQPAPTTAEQSPRSLMVCVDKTQSGSDEALREFVSMLKDGITACDNLSEIIVVDVGLDGKGAWNAAAKKFPVPPRPAGDLTSELARVKEEVRTKCGGRVNCEQHELAAAEEKLRSKAAEENHAYQLAFSQVIDTVVKAIMQSPRIEPHCTNLTEMAERIVHTPSTHVIWLTDGEHNCKTPLVGQPFRNRVLLGLLPLANEADGTYGKRLALLQQTFTGADIQPVTAINEQAVIAFLKS
jgi:hypothetical protein